MGVNLTGSRNLLLVVSHDCVTLVKPSERGEFPRSPGHGIAFLVAIGIIRDFPVEINNFLVRSAWVCIVLRIRL